MIRTDRAFSEAVTRAVAGAERGTGAELIVVVAARSGTYLDVALLAGAAVAVVNLLIALFAPTIFPPAVVAVEVPFEFALAAWLAHRTPALLRALTPSARRRRQVERAAAAHFVGEAVHGTRGRTGLLVYLSLLEEEVALIPDLGLTGKIPSVLWSGVSWAATGDRRRPRSSSDFAGGIEQIGAILRTRLPSADTDGNESPDAPRFVS